MTAQRPFRIAIIGGGIGGLYAALSIHHHTKDQDVHIDVYEQASEFREIGAGVGLAVNAAKLVHKLGLGDQLNAIAGHRNGIWIDFRRFDNGERIIAIETNDQEKIRQSPVSRSDLLDMLRHAIEDRKAATLHTKKRFNKVDDNGDHVTVHFEDSTTAVADLVIACDGIHSAARAQFITDHSVYSGQIAYRATIPISELKDWPHSTYSVCWCGKYKHFLVFPISANKTLNVVAFANAKAKDAEKVAESWVSTCDRKDVEEDYSAFTDPTVKQIISLMPDQPSKWRINDRPPLDRWFYMEGKVMLAGDAAHAMLPHMGAGAGQAIEDGWILGRTLGEYIHGSDTKRLGTLEQCANHYQKVRLPRAQKVQQQSRGSGALYGMQNEKMLPLGYEECVPILADGLKDRMKFIWAVELDKVYDDAKENVNGSTNGGGH